MNTWYSLALGDRNDSLPKIEKIQKEFWPFFTDSKQPENMGVFSKYDNGADLVTVYFPPNMEALAKSLGAKECEKPSSAGIRFVVGAGHSPDIHFPDRLRHQHIK